MSQQLLIALVFGAFAFAFATLWRNNRSLHCAGLWTLSYLSAAFGFLFEHMFLMNADLRFLTPVGDTFYLLSPALLTAGLAVRYGRKIPDLALFFIVMLTIMKAYWFWFIEDNFVLRTEIISYACAAMLALGAYVVYSRMKTHLDKALCFAISASSAQLVITTYTSLYVWPEAMTEENFQQSTYVEILNHSVGLIAISLALLLLAGLIVDIRQKQSSLSKESDRAALV